MSNGAIRGKVAIVGAGDVGATAAYALMDSEAINDIVLVDIDRDKAEGEAMDLGHGASFVKPVRVSAGDYEDVYLSLPSVVNRRGVDRTIELPLADAEREGLVDSAGVLRDHIGQLDL